MFQNLPLPAAQEVRDSSSVTPCIVMKNDGVLYQQVLYIVISGEYGGCSRISHYQQHKSSVTAAVWLLALSWRMMEFCTNKCCRFLMSTCDYDLFTKVKEPLRGTWYNTRDELINAIGQSIWNIIKDGCTNGVWHLPNIWQKVINKGTTILKVHKCCTLWLKSCEKYQTVAITFYATLVIAILKIVLGFHSQSY